MSGGGTGGGIFRKQLERESAMIMEVGTRLSEINLFMVGHYKWFAIGGQDP